MGRIVSAFSGGAYCAPRLHEGAIDWRLTGSRATNPPWSDATHLVFAPRSLPKHHQPRRPAEWASKFLSHRRPCSYSPEASTIPLCASGGRRPSADRLGDVSRHVYRAFGERFRRRCPRDPLHPSIYLPAFLRRGSSNRPPAIFRYRALQNLGPHLRPLMARYGYAAPLRTPFISDSRDP